jgi:hypothetical protein
MGCGCGREVIEQGASIYLGKVAKLQNGLTLRISQYDPEDARRFAGKDESGNLVWFTLSDVATLKK